MQHSKRPIVEMKLENQSEKQMLCVVVFPHGKINPEADNAVVFSCYGKSNRTNFSGNERLLVARTDRLHYSANTSDPWTQGSRFKCCRYFIGVRNRKTDIMKIYSTCLFMCHPILKYIAPTPTSVDETLSYSEKLASLSSTFGSKKKRKAIEMKAKYMVDSNCMASIQENLEKINFEKTETTTTQSQDDAAIPPKNTNATSVESVFSIRDIISDQEYSALSSITKSFCTATKEELSEWEQKGMCTYVMQHLRHSSGISAHKATLLYYYNLFIVLLKLGYKDLRKKDPLPQIDELVKTNLLRKYTTTVETDYETPKRSMSPKMKDKVIAHAIVLALFIDNFRLSISSLQDLKVPTPKLTMIAYALGCRVTHKSVNGLQSKFIELKLPLYVSNKKFNRKSKK